MMHLRRLMLSVVIGISATATWVLGESLAWSATSQEYGHLAALADKSFYQAIAEEFKKEPDLINLHEQAEKSRPKSERGAALEKVLPKFKGTLASVMLSTHAGEYYMDAGRVGDARRVCKVGIAAGEQIVEQYPEARFSAEVHTYIAIMFSWPSDRTKQELRAALAHINEAIRLVREDEKNARFSRMAMKADILAHLGEEVACMAVYDQLLKTTKDEDLRLMAEVGRARNLLRLGKKEAARLELQRIVRENPDSRWAGIASEELKKITESETPDKE